MDLIKESGLNLMISYYDERSFVINGKEYSTNLYINSLDHIASMDKAESNSNTIIQKAISLNSVDEIFLIGTGASLNHDMMIELLSHSSNYPFEVMNTASAVRTFNIVKSDGRKVSAILLLNH
jgi:uncharacterized protein